MDIVEFNESYSHVFDSKKENLPARYAGKDCVVRTFNYEGKVYVMQERGKLQMYQDVGDAVKFASVMALGDAKVFEKCVNEFLVQREYLSDCVVETLSEMDQLVGEQLREVYVRGCKKDDELER